MPYPFNYGYNTYPSSYTPYSYGSYPQYQPTPQMPQQPMMQNTQQTAQPIQTQIASPSSIIWVKNQQEAAMYPIAPNNAVALWDSASPSIYLKQADASGKPSMKIYDLVERTEAPAESQNENGVKTTAYATKEELGAVVGAIKGIDGIIAGIKGDIEKMNGDLYGIAGVKKRLKKVKDDDTEDDD
jgi:hypothetical protein